MFRNVLFAVVLVHIFTGFLTYVLAAEDKSARLNGLAYGNQLRSPAAAQRRAAVIAIHIDVTLPPLGPQDAHGGIGIAEVRRVTLVPQLLSNVAMVRVGCEVKG